MSCLMPPRLGGQQERRGQEAKLQCLGRKSPLKGDRRPEARETHWLGLPLSETPE